MTLALAVVLAEASDLLTFVLAVKLVPLSAELNPIARATYSEMGPLGPSLVKIAGTLLILLILSRVRGRVRTVGAAIVIAMALIGAAANTYAGLNA